MNVTPINEIPSIQAKRYQTKIAGLDNLLGGGFVDGNALLLAGECGSGKSTLMLQVAQQLADQNYKVFYASGEENLNQIKLRADRLNTLNPHILCSETINLEELQEVVKETEPRILIVDSLQMIYSKELKQGVGSPSQMRYCLNELIKWVKQTNNILIVIGHSTKTGLVAGIMTLQHMVDAVFFMSMVEGDTRQIYSRKNRFGTSQYAWMIKMSQNGIIDCFTPPVEAQISNSNNSIPKEEQVILTNNEIKETLSHKMLDRFAINNQLLWLLRETHPQISKITGFDIVFKY